MLHGIARHKFAVDRKPENVPLAVALDVPVAGDLPSVLLVLNGIEDGLLRQPRRKTAPARFFDEAQLGRPDRPLEGDGHIGHVAT